MKLQTSKKIRKQNNLETTNKHDEEIAKERYIFPEEKKIIDDLGLK